MPGAVHLTGRLDTAALQAALAAVVRRHEALRAVFPLDPARGGEPAQRLAPAPAGARACALAWTLPAVDLAALPAAARGAEMERLSREEARRPFDLARGPVFRTRLLRLAGSEHRLLATFHHIAADGWSLGLFLDELAALYPALAGRSPGAPRLPALPVQYADFAAWQAGWLRGEVLADELAYWRERLAGLPVLELPLDHPRPAPGDPRGRRGARRALRLPAPAAAALDGLARRQGVTRFMVLLGIFQALLARWTGEDVIPVGSPVANRRRPEVERLIGFFVNTLVLDARAGDDPALGDFLSRVRQACLGAYAHQDLPFERLVEELAPRRDLAQNPLFQVVLVVEEPLPSIAAGGLAMRPLRADGGTAKFDLTVTVSPPAPASPDPAWDLLAEYPAALWEPSTIDRLLGHFRALLIAAAAADPAARLSQLSLLSPAERQQLVVEWNDTAAASPRGARLHDLIAAQAARLPDAVAVVGPGVRPGVGPIGPAIGPVSRGDARLTYGELLARARRLGAFLRSRGVGPEARVGLAVERGPALLVGALGILEAGGVYVPLDPTYPHDRLRWMLADSGAALLLTESALAGRLAFAGPTIRLDADWERIAASDPGHASQRTMRTMRTMRMTRATRTSPTSSTPRARRGGRRGSRSPTGAPSTWCAGRSRRSRRTSAARSRRPRSASTSRSSSSSRRSPPAAGCSSPPTSRRSPRSPPPPSCAW